MKDQKVAIITGISSGIGYELGIKLALEGVFVVGNYCRNSTGAKNFESHVRDVGGMCRVIKSDFSTPSNVNFLIDIAVSINGKIDYLINNAAAYQRKQLNEISCDDFIRMNNVNLVAPFLLCQQSIPYLLKSENPRIINISSIVAQSGYSRSVHYCSSKAGLIGLTKSLAKELAPKINVNCVCPGFIETTQIRKDSTDLRKERLSSILLERLGQAADIVHSIQFLLSPSSNYITGEVLNVSGGYYV